MISFEATFIDSSLFVQAWIYNMSTGTPVGPTKVNMSEVTPGTYAGAFMPSADASSYLIIKRVFTSGTYLTADAAYAPSSSSVDVDSGAGSSDLCGLTVILSSDQLNVLLSSAHMNVISLSSSLITEMSESTLSVPLESSEETVLLEESTLSTQLDSSELDPIIESSDLTTQVTEDSLTVIFTCDD